MSPSPTPVKALTTQESNSMQAVLEREKDRLKLLLDMTNTLVSNLECRDLLRTVSASIQRVMQCDSVSVWLPDSKQGQLRAHALEFPESKGFAKEDLLLPLEGSLIGSVFKTGKPLVVGGKTDFMSEEVTPEALAEGLESGCALPLISRNRTLGVLTLANRGENSFSPEDIDFLVRVAGQVAIAIENASLYSDLQRSEAFLAEGQSISHTGSFGWNVSNGEIYWSEETYNIFQHDRAVKPTLELVFRRIYPDDRDRVQQAFDRATNEKTDFDIEHRLLMPDGSVKYLHVLARALEPSSGNLEYVGVVTEVTAAKRAEESLRESEAYLTEAQRLSQTGSFGCRLSTGEMFWSEETFRIYGYGQSTKPTVEHVLQRIHPEDKPLVQEHMDRASREGKACDVECRLLLHDDSVKHVRIVAHAEKNESGIREFIGAVMDVSAAKRAEEKLRRSEAYLAEAQKLSHTGSLGWHVSSGKIYWSDETFRIFEFEPATQPTLERIFERMHPEDRQFVRQAIDSAAQERKDFDFEHRLLIPDGSVKHVHVLARALETSSGNLEYVGAVTDVTAAKQAEQTLRESEAYLAEAQRLSHTGSCAWIPATGDIRYWSEECYRVLGFDPHGGKPRFEAFFQRIHPDDQAKFRETGETAVREKAEFELDYRIVHPGGEIRVIHVVGHVNLVCRL